jgi:hypothetical protein
MSETDLGYIYIRQLYRLPTAYVHVHVEYTLSP